VRFFLLVFLSSFEVCIVTTIWWWEVVLMCLTLILLHLLRMVYHILNLEILLRFKSVVSLAEESRLWGENVLLLNKVVIIINVYTIYYKLFLLGWYFLLDCGVTLVTGGT